MADLHYVFSSYQVIILETLFIVLKAWCLISFAELEQDALPSNINYYIVLSCRGIVHRRLPNLLLQSFGTEGLSR
jgi:hypothetical protein